MEETVVPQKVLPQPKIVVGFWKRLLAMILDTLIVGAVCAIIGIFFRSQLYVFGEDGWWVGFIILLCYFGIMQTSIGAGQSVGQKIMRIQVLKMDGSFMSLLQSIGRFLILALVLFYSEFSVLIPEINVTAKLNLLGGIYYFVIISLAAGIVFMIWLHPQKRGLHDLLCGTVVVKKGNYNPEQLSMLFDKKKLKKAINISLIMFFIMIGVYLVASKMINSFFNDNSPAFKVMLNIKNSIEDASYMKNVQVKFITKMGNDQSKMLFVSGFVYKDVYDDAAKCKELTKRIGDMVNTKGNELKELGFNRIVLEIRSGYNIWVTNASYKKHEEINPENNIN